MTELIVFVVIALLAGAYLWFRRKKPSGRFPRDISKTVRIDAGPVRRKAIATEELLSDLVTAGHYRAPRPATAEEIKSEAIMTKDGKRYWIDALCKPIELGEEFTYVDWKSPERAYTVYALEGGKYLPKSVHKTLKEAEEAAMKLR